LVEKVLDFMLTPPVQLDSAEAEGLVVFVLDISGSMCVSTEIPKGFGLFQVFFVSFHFLFLLLLSFFSFALSFFFLSFYFIYLFI
jgi:hypothetical protein